MSLDRFMTVYANVPIGARKEIILTIEYDGKDKPITWDVAYIEVSNKTPLGDKILKKLVELKII